MTDQIIDKKTVAIPGPMGDVTPAALAAKTAAAASAAAAASSATAAAQSATSAQQVRDMLPVETGPLIAAYFLSKDERAYIARSADGVTFEPTGARYEAPSGSTVRDPTIVRFGGQYLLMHTRPTTTGGGAFGTINTLGLVTSTDLRTWTAQTPLSYSSLGGNTVKRIWAPEFVMQGSTLYAIFSVAFTDSTASSAFTAWETHTTNGTSWSAPTQVSGLSTGIDWHMTKTADGIWHVLFARNSRIFHGTASAVTGPWTIDAQEVDASWAYAEAPCTVPLSNGGWRVYVDSGGLFSTIFGSGSESDSGMFYSDFSADFSSHTALRPVASPLRHMTVIPADSGNTRQDQFSRSMPRCAGNLSIPGGESNTNDVEFTISTAQTYTQVPFTHSSCFGGIGATSDAKALIVPESGMYLVSASLGIRSTNAGEWYEVCVGVNGAPTKDSNYAGVAGKASDVDWAYTGSVPAHVRYLSQGDVLSLWVRGGATGARQARSRLTWLTVASV